MPNTSRTWQPYSSGDQVVGVGRARAVPAASTGCQPAALARSIAGICSRGNACVSKPHSGQGRLSTHVQSFVSGVIATTADPSRRPHRSRCHTSGVGQELRTRLTWAGVAFVGAMVPLIAVTQWPGEIILFLLLTVGVGVPLGLYVLLIRTRIAALATGIVLAAAGVVVPLPGYPQFLRGVAGPWGYVLLLLPAILFGLWLLGWIADLLVRADQRLGDPGRPPEPGTALVLAGPVRPPVARGVASVVPPRALEAGTPRTRGGVPPGS